MGWERKIPNYSLNLDQYDKDGLRARIIVALAAVAGAYLFLGLAYSIYILLVSLLSILIFLKTKMRFRDPFYEFWTIGAWIFTTGIILVFWTVGGIMYFFGFITPG